LSAATQKIIHASSVSCDGRAVLILGASGTGKSTLALDLMSRCAVLISDDRTRIAKDNDGLVASAPDAIRGQIEARGIGILAASYAGPTRISLVVDLDKAPPERLPQARRITMLNVEIDLIYGAGLNNLAPAILQFLKGGRVA
jgi:HPr kinase/phosphorylase